MNKNDGEAAYRFPVSTLAHADKFMSQKRITGHIAAQFRSSLNLI